MDGFRYGFDLEYRGDSKVRRYSPNLKIRQGVGSEVEMWNKVMKEVRDKRYAGPFEEPPFDHFIQSPIGLVPKDKSTKTRLIFHLSYLRHTPKHSINGCIKPESRTVKYPDFEEAVRTCLQEGVGCAIGKSDMSMAFRNVPLKRYQWHLLVLKAEHPITKKLYYFFDKCLPFGSSISCAIF